MLVTARSFPRKIDHKRVITRDEFYTVRDAFEWTLSFG